MGADAPTTHLHLNQFLHDNTLRTHHPVVVLGYDEKNQRDQEAARQLAELLPRYELLRCEAQGAHNALQPALKSGRLASLLNQMLHGEPDRWDREQMSGSNERRAA